MMPYIPEEGAPDCHCCGGKMFRKPQPIGDAPRDLKWICGCQGVAYGSSIPSFMQPVKEEPRVSQREYRREKRRKFNRGSRRKK